PAQKRISADHKKICEKDYETSVLLTQNTYLIQDKLIHGRFDSIDRDLIEPKIENNEITFQHNFKENPFYILRDIFPAVVNYIFFGMAIYSKNYGSAILILQGGGSINSVMHCISYLEKNWIRYH